MLPIFGFLLYIVAIFIASKVYELRSGLYEVPLAIIGPSHPLLDTSMHPSPSPESANFTTGEWLLLLGSVAFFITLVSLWVIIIWVSVAHPWFLDEVYGKCFISTVDIDDAPWSQQEARDPEEDHLIALKEKDATISLKSKKISKLESELRDLKASATRKLEEANSAAAEKLSSIEADNAALRVILDELKLSHQAISIDHDKKLASKVEDLMKLGASSTRLLEEANSAAAEKQSSIEADNATLRMTLDELKLSHQAFSIEHDKKLASKEEDLLKIRTSSTRLLEEANSAAAEKQSSIEAENAALRMTLDELKLSHQTVSVEHDKKLASKEEDLLKIRARSTRLLEEANSAAAEKQSSIEADNAALRMSLDELKLGHQAVSIEHEKNLASKEEDLLKIRANSIRLLEEAESAAAKKQSSIEADNAALRMTLEELKLSHQAVGIEQDKKLADLLELGASSALLLEEAKSAAAEKLSSIEADNAALRVTLDELKLIHQAASIEQDKKLASKEEDLMKLGASSTRLLEEANLAAAKKQGSIEADNAALRVTLDELKLSHQAVSIEHDKRLASKEEDLLKLRANSKRQLEEANLAAAEKQSSMEADNVALRMTLDELKLSYEAVSIEHEKKLASKEKDLLELRASSTRLLEEAKSAAAKKQSSIEADIEHLRVTLDELKLLHQAASIEQDKKLASKEQDLLELGASSTRLLEEAKSAAAEKQSSIEADNAALRVALDELKLIHQAVGIEQDKKLASKEEDLMKLCASSTRLLEEAIAAAEKQSSIEADIAALRVTLDEIKFSHQAASIEQDKKLASKEEDLLKFEHRIEEGLAFFAEREKIVGKLHSQEMANIIEKYTKESKATARRNERAIRDLEEVTEELKRRQTTIEFGEVEEAVGSDLQLQLQHHSDYVTRLERWLTNSAPRKEKLAGLFDAAGSPNIRLPTKPQAKSDSSWSAEEAETRHCTEYLFAETGSPKVRLPKAQDAPNPVPPPAKDDLALMDPARIPLPEDEDLNLLAPEWIPLPEGDDSELLEPEWIPLPEEIDLEFLMPEGIPLPNDEDLDLLPDLPDSEDLDLAPKGPTTKPPTTANKGSRAIPPRGAPKAPKAMLALNARGSPKRGASSRGSSWSRGGWVGQLPEQQAGSPHPRQADSRPKDGLWEVNFLIPIATIFPIHFLHVNENGGAKLIIRVARGNAASEMLMELEILEARTKIQRYGLDDESQARRIIIPVNSSFVTVLSPGLLLTDAIIRWYHSQIQPYGFEDLTELMCPLGAVPNKEIVSEEEDFAVAVGVFTERYPTFRYDLEEKIECSKI